MNKAPFSLKKYRFEKVDIDLLKVNSDDLHIDFSPSGKFISSDSSFELSFLFTAHSGKEKHPFIKIKGSR